MSLSSQPLLSAALADQTVESLYAMHGRRRPWIYWISLVGVGAAVGVLPLLQVDVTVRSAGMLRPASERAEIKSALGGHVERVWAHDNERVEAGQPLVEMTARDAAERLARNRALQQEKAGMLGDLELITGGLANAARAEDSPANLETLLRSMQTPALSRAFAQFVAQLDGNRLTIGKMTAGYDRTRALASKGIVTAQECDDARYARDRAVSDLDVLVRQSLAGWQSQLRDEVSARDQLLSEEKRLREELGLAIIRAPAAGTVQGLVGLAEGTYVGAGQSLGFVSPAEPLRVETFVSPKDIGLIRVGQPVRLQIDAYPYTEWGLVEGSVQSVGADATMSGTQAAFRVIVRPAVLVLRLPSGVSGALRKGMTLTARFVVARRSLLQIFYEDASKWLDPRQGPASP